MSLELEILDLLRDVDEDFQPALSCKLNLVEYARKLSINATIFSIYENGKIIAITAVYCNDLNGVRAYIPLIAIRGSHRRLGFGSQLLKSVVQYLSSKEFTLLTLEVYKSNNAALNFYQEFGFSIESKTERSVFLGLPIKKNQGLECG